MCPERVCSKRAARTTMEEISRKDVVASCLRPWNGIDYHPEREFGWERTLPESGVLSQPILNP